MSEEMKIIPGTYKNVVVTAEELPSVELTQEELEDQIQMYLESRVEWKEIKEDREVELGDTVDIDFEGFVNEVAFEGGKAEHFDLAIGSHSFIDGFEDQILGHKKGDEFDVIVTFPENYTEDLAGKEARFAIKLHAIKEEVEPELNEELIKEITQGECSTEEQFRTELAKRMQEHKKTEFKTVLTNKVLEKILADSTLENIPEEMIQAKVNETVEGMKQQLSGSGMELEAYLGYMGKTMEDYLSDIRPGAETGLKVELLMTAIARNENLLATEEEINKQMEMMAEHYQMPVEMIKEYAEKGGMLEVIRQDIAVQKAVVFVVEAADIQ